MTVQEYRLGLGEPTVLAIQMFPPGLHDADGNVAVPGLVEGVAADLDLT